METIDKTSLTLIPLVQGKSYSETEKIVSKWVISRTDNNLDPALKWASLSGILEANITMLLMKISELEKRSL